MSIVIDINTLSPVFDSDNKDHNEFKPVLDWIRGGRGQIVWGGSRYLKELPPKFRRIFIELANVKKVIRAKDEEVDAEEQRIRGLHQHRDFVDQHIVAIVIVSGCLLVCTSDKRSTRFLKDKQFYPSGRQIPKIYSSSKNKGLLCDKYISDHHKPGEKLTRKQTESLSVAAEKESN